MDENIPWKIIDKYFKDNPQALVNHQIESYNDFFEEGIQRILKEKNPVKILKQQDPETDRFKLQASIYFGGYEGNRLYYGKPIIYDESHEHYMYPNDARLRNMTYAITIHYDVIIDYTMEDDDGNIIETSTTLEKIFLGRFPIMLQSKLCIMNGLDRNVRYMMGECKNDLGGYFIIDGKEKVIVSQEKFADNMLYIRDKVNEIYSHSAEIRSVSEDASKPIRTLSVRIVAESSKYTNNQIVVNIPNVRKPIPLFIVMRALGITSDKSIIECCLLDMEKYNSYIDLFIPSIHDASKIFTQENAIKYIATFTKGKTIVHVMEILADYFLPHIGELNFKDKACFLGYMVLELLKVFMKENKSTDRDSFKFKRVELPGSLIYDLFKEYYTLQQRNIYLKIDKEYYYKKGIYEKNFLSLIDNNYKEFFKERIVEEGFRKAFKGNWGAEAHTKRLGAVQDLNRLSFNSALSLLRKVNLPLDSSAKVVGPRLLHSSQWGLIDPVDTPDGGNIGLHKHLAIMTKITKFCSSKPIINWLRFNVFMKKLDEVDFKYMSRLTKIFVNGAWVGIVDDPEATKELLVFNRRNGLIPIYTSIHWHIETNIIYIYTDSGRLCRPIFYIDQDGPSIMKKNILEKINNNDFTWEDLISGFNEKVDSNYSSSKCKLYMSVKDLYKKSKENLIELKNNQSIIDYIDTAEEEVALICMDYKKLSENNLYTHLEIHPSLIFGIMGNQIIFPENNQLPRDLFSCGQSKQAVSLYHSNFLTRIDKMGVILNYGQIPLIKSRYMKYINNEEHPYGENVIVAIGIYGSYNVEDSILFNEGSIKRGMFRTTYYNMYEDREDSSKVGNSTIDSRFANIENENVIGLKPGYDYSYLNDSGLIKENTFLDDKKVIIGKVQTNLSNPNTSLDSSVFPKKGQLGYVDKSFITEGEEGFRIAKVRIREERIPAIGDKFCSRCGQKGTVGLIIPEEDMPYTEEGIRPDIIINPHALPSRMTIGQLVETLMGKVGCEYGAFGDCTAFVNKGTKNKIYGDLLTQIGYHSSGNQLLYNGQTGEQMESEIFIGPTYYMRLKHMVKDKINYRARGPRTLLTRQTVQGRANDGGLRVGEMERDGIASHGLSHFLQESLLVRGDEYYMAVCNLTGMICIYNSDLNLFMSPMADGPIKFSGNLENGMSIDNITQYGRTFSIVRVPYAFKLLIQELQAMNIQIRIITDKNIDQITSMGFNKSIESIEQPVVKKIKKDKKIKLGEINQQPDVKPQQQDDVIEQPDKEEPIEQVQQIEEPQQEPEIQPEEPEVEPEIQPVVQEELPPELDIEEPQDNITNIPLINKNLNKMEDIIEGKPVVSILEGGKYNKHDEYVKEEFEILGDLDEEEGEDDGEEEYENNNKIRSVEFN